jgi:glycosyltransferase involved in cell wall biosynthesis
MSHAPRSLFARLKSRAYQHLPLSAQRWLTARLVDRFDPEALERFQQAQRLTAPLERDWRGGVAVIMPCYNHAAYLEAALASLAAQTYRPFEIVCVEDHSTDDTWSRLQRACAQLPAGIRSTLLRTPHNSGQAAAINLGVASSESAAFMILNDDDYLMHDALEAAVEILKREADLFLLGATAIHIAGADQLMADDPRLLIRNLIPDYARISLTYYQPADVLNFTRPNDLNMSHSGSIFFKAAWQAVGGYQSDKSRRVIAYSDRDFQLRMASLFPVAVSAQVPFAYWRSDSSVDQGRNS